MAYSICFLVPSVPLNLHVCKAKAENLRLCITWNKPEGGNEIDSYIIEWTMQNDTMAYLQALGSNEYSHTIENLQPGQKVNATVSASNSASTGKAACISYSCK